MERLGVAQKSPKQSKVKKKTIKVTYISNPMRVRTSESEFRGVVQELTGKDSDVADSMAKYPVMAENENGPPVRVDVKEEIAGEVHKEKGIIIDHGPSFEMFDEGLSNLPGLMPSLHFYDYQEFGLQTFQ